MRNIAGTITAAEEAFVRAVMKNMRGRGWDPKKVKQQIKADAEQKYFQPQDYEK